MLANLPISKPELAPFRPHPLLRNSHLQTIAGAYLFKTKIRYDAKPHFVLFDDGDQLVLHDDCPKTWKPGDRVVVMIAGLGGCHQSEYLVRIAHRLEQHGIRIFRVDLRSCGAGAKLAKRPFHAGCSQDIATALETIAVACPGSPTSLVGFSMGANIVLKLAAEIGASPYCGVDSVLAVAPPIDLEHCCRNMSNGLNRLYDWDFSRKMIQLVQERQAFDPEIFKDFRFAERPGSLFDFDEQFTAPLSGFESATDYYTQCSSGPLLRNIEINGAILTADDDTIVPVEIFDRFEIPSHIDLQITRGGGHLGYLASRDIVPDRRWMDAFVVNWLVSIA